MKLEVSLSQEDKELIRRERRDGGGAREMRIGTRERTEKGSIERIEKWSRERIEIERNKRELK